MKFSKIKLLRNTIEQIVENLNDNEAAVVSELFPKWKINIYYNVGDRVQYNGILWKTLIAHVSQENWSPEASPSLFAQILIPDPEIIPEWIQPQSTNPYKIGDKVIHNQKIWESIIDNNIWQPGIYGWQEI